MAFDLQFKRGNDLSPGETCVELIPLS